MERHTSGCSHASMSSLDTLFSSCCITAVVSEQLFADLGVPSVIQGDRGTEFLGYVTSLSKALNAC